MIQYIKQSVELLDYPAALIQNKRLTGRFPANRF
jgi:hypothetical protein